VKKINHLILAVTALTLLALSACHYSKEYKEVQVSDKFTLMVPPWVKEDQTLKPGADFQYANRFRNFYAIAEVEGKDSTKSVSSLTTAHMAILAKAMTDAKTDDSTNVTIGGLPGVRVEYRGLMTGEAIYFSEVVLKGKTRFYHLSIWTRTADRKLKFKDDIDKIINSFKEQ
jgi:hypothetical protein